MATTHASHATGSGHAEGTRGPDDDFYCLKYRVWYRVEDCVYRGRHKTFAGCVNCFQGYLNIRSHEKGIAPPDLTPPDLARPGVATRQGAKPGSVVPFALPTRNS